MGTTVFDLGFGKSEIFYVQGHVYAWVRTQSSERSLSDNIHFFTKQN